MGGVGSAGTGVGVTFSLALITAGDGSLELVSVGSSGAAAAILVVGGGGGGREGLDVCL